MKEFVDGFKVDLDELMDELYQKLDQLICDALFNMSFFEGDVDDHYAQLQEVMIEVIQERIGMAFDKDEGLN